MPNKPGLWNRLVDYLGFGPEEDEFEDEELEEEAAPVAYQEEPRRSAASDRRDKVVPISAVPSNKGAVKVIVVEPRSFEEVQTIVDQMKARRPVILNLESLDKDLAQKILNFLNGAIYALNGETQRVSAGIFFYAPPGVDVSTMGRGLTGTAIGGGAVDLPPGVLEKLTGQSAGSRESDLLARATGRKEEGDRTAVDRSKFDWRSE
ncbi:cell division inhibitor SepF [Symbiobacterium terraclitae]|jgi:cell division inhibitor SepF|uniref:Cell division protein SepF n=1 Tax=Symbiobacterium terraclitae TaxID=557451 RepID=A0ABS4JNN0_9FIRM|nr:cell division protein SepF [Symbiobacterium terraclitae]MBP2017138.1 cell division inhibitor SepF [Symbiobacterium terraclitae]